MHASPGAEYSTRATCTAPTVTHCHYPVSPAGSSFHTPIHVDVVLVLHPTIAEITEGVRKWGEMGTDGGMAGRGSG